RGTPWRHWRYFHGVLRLRFASLRMTASTCSLFLGGFGFRFRFDVRLDAFLLHLAQDVAHVVDLIPDFLAHIHRRLLLRRHRDAIARTPIELDDFFLLQFVLGPNDHARVVGRVLEV